MNQPIRQAQGEKGFSQIILLSIIAVLVLAGAGSFLLVPKNIPSENEKIPSSENEKTVRKEESMQKMEEQKPLPETKSSPKQSLPSITKKTIKTSPEPMVVYEKQKPQTQWQPVEPQSSLPQCGDKKELFTTLPINPSDLKFIRPLGFIGAAPEHIYPTDHVYFFLKRDASGHAIEVPVYSPGDIWITRIKEIKMERPVPNSTDYSIYFSPCQEFEAFYFHLSTITEKIKSEMKPPFKYCQEEDIGRFKQVACEKDVRIKLNAGERMGTVGQLDWQYSFDLGAYDMRTPPLDYANPSRWQEWQKHIICPFDYFSEEVKRKLKAQLGEDNGEGNVLRTIEPTCGKIEQDEFNTAEGVWFLRGEKRMYARPELSLIHDFIDPRIGAFAFGNVPREAELQPNVLHFTPKNSGLVNRDFKDVTEDGKIYCYDNLVKQWSYDKKPEQLTILIQLTSPTNLFIEGKEATSCGNGAWSFNKGAEFER